MTKAAKPPERRSRHAWTRAPRGAVRYRAHGSHAPPFGIARTAPARHRSASRSSGPARAANPERVDWPRAGAEPAQAVADGLGGDALGLARGGLEVVAPGQARGERRRVRAARAVRSAIRIAGSGELVCALAVEDDVDRFLAMASGH